jgi:hypothetical protein
VRQFTSDEKVARIACGGPAGETATVEIHVAVRVDLANDTGIKVAAGLTLQGDQRAIAYPAWVLTSIASSTRRASSGDSTGVVPHLICRERSRRRLRPAGLPSLMRNRASTFADVPAPSP